MTQKNLPWIIVRPTIVYGSREKNFFNMIKAVDRGMDLYVGSKKQMLSFIHVSDLADVFIKLSVGNFSQKVYNISDGEDYSATKVNQIIKSVLSRKTLTIVLPIVLVRLMAFLNELFTQN